MKNLIITILILLMMCHPVMAQIKISTLLTTEGLDKQGFPVTFKKEFSLSKDKGVQYYLEWISDNRDHDVVIKWFNANDQLINYLVLNNFSQNIVRDYISFSEKKKNQLIIPNQSGVYYIYLYIDKKLISITKFEVNQ